MFRQSPSRIQRSKSFKVKKHGLQIFLLLAICLWLLYQVKHSHDKKKAFDENSMKLNAKLEDDRELTKLGRKDLHPRVEENISETESRGKEEVIEEDEEIKPEEEDEEEKPEEGEEEEEEEEENKPEEEEQEEEEEKNKQEEEEEAEEEENKPEENERKRGDGDDEMDEHGQQRAEEEAEREEGFVDEEEKGAKEESEAGENEEKVQKSEKVVSSDDQDHDRNTQEAREENYKGDDASSAVLRETQVLTTEAESGNLGDVTNKELVENAEKSEFKLDETNATQKITYAQKNPDQDAVVEEISVNLKTSKEKRNDGSQANSTVPKSDDLPVVSNSSMAEGVHTPSSHTESRTNTSSGSTQNQTHELVTARGSESELQAVDQAENSNIIAVEDKSDSTSELSVTTVNADVAKEEFSNTSNNAETVALNEQIGKSGEENNSMSLDANKIKYGAQSEKVETADGAKESDNSKSSSTTNERDVVKILTNESTNHTVLNEEKDDARTDLGTLPGFENRGKNAEDAAVE